MLRPDLPAVSSDDAFKRLKRSFRDLVSDLDPLKVRSLMPISKQEMHGDTTH